MHHEGCSARRSPRLDVRFRPQQLVEQVLKPKGTENDSKSRRERALTKLSGLVLGSVSFVICVSLEAYAVEPIRHMRSRFESNQKASIAHECEVHLQSNY